MNEIIKTIVITIIGSLGIAGIIIKINRSKKSSNNSRVVQKGNTVSGDQAGRDIHK